MSHLTVLEPSVPEFAVVTYFYFNNNYWFYRKSDHNHKCVVVAF